MKTAYHSDRSTRTLQRYKINRNRAQLKALKH